MKDGSRGPEMVIVPAGEFQMGDIQGGGESLKGRYIPFAS